MANFDIPPYPLADSIDRDQLSHTDKVVLLDWMKDCRAIRERAQIAHHRALRAMHARRDQTLFTDVDLDVQEYSWTIEEYERDSFAPFFPPCPGELRRLVVSGQPLNTLQRMELIQWKMDCTLIRMEMLLEQREKRKSEVQATADALRLATDEELAEECPWWWETLACSTSDADSNCSNHDGENLGDSNSDVSDFELDADMEQVDFQAFV
jgi:hypothetical protein